MDGDGFKLIETYDRKPMTPVVCLKAQMYIGKIQREVMMATRREEMKKREEERRERFGDDDLDDGPTNEEIDAMLRD